MRRPSLPTIDHRLDLRDPDRDGSRVAGQVALRDLRIALVHDWLITLGGADRVLLALHELFPHAAVFVSLYDPSRLPNAFHGLDVRCTWLQRIPGATRRHRLLVPLMPLAFRSVALRDYDVVLSSSHACAKGVQVPPDAVHICYCHTPMRYAWDLTDDYLAAIPWLVRPVARAALGWLREWDRATAQRVDYFLANSRFVADRIRRHYRREATIIYPPVDTDYFTPGDRVENFYLTVARLVPYKRVDLAVRAFNRLGLPLVVVGEGPERPRLQALARPHIKFVGEVPDATLREYYRRCRALIFPGVEDFGIVPVEAMACGRPVIAFGRGGALESVVPQVTGIFFSELSADALAAAVETFDAGACDPAVIRGHALRFSRRRFHAEIAEFVGQIMKDGHAGSRERGNAKIESRVTNRESR